MDEAGTAPSCEAQHPFDAPAAVAADDASLFLAVEGQKRRSDPSDNAEADARRTGSGASAPVPHTSPRKGPVDSVRPPSSTGMSHSSARSSNSSIPPQAGPAAVRRRSVLDSKASSCAMTTLTTYVEAPSPGHPFCSRHQETYTGRTHPTTGVPIGLGEKRCGEIYEFRGYFDSDGLRTGPGSLIFTRNLTAAFQETRERDVPTAVHCHWEKDAIDDRRPAKVEYRDGSLYYGVITVARAAPEEGAGPAAGAPAGGAGSDPSAAAQPKSAAEAFVGYVRSAVILRAGTGELCSGASREERYFGSWKANRRSGYGVQLYKNGAKFYGQWDSDRRHGLGTMLYADGSLYEGLWARNERSGNGILYLPNGTVASGVWKASEIVQKAKCSFNPPDHASMWSRTRVADAWTAPGIRAEGSQTCVSALLAAAQAARTKTKIGTTRWRHFRDANAAMLEERARCEAPDSPFILIIHDFLKARNRMSSGTTPCLDALSALRDSDCSAIRPQLEACLTQYLRRALDPRSKHVLSSLSSWFHRYFIFMYGTCGAGDEVGGGPQAAPLKTGFFDDAFYAAQQQELAGAFAARDRDKKWVGEPTAFAGWVPESNSCTHGSIPATSRGLSYCFGRSHFAGCIHRGRGAKVQAYHLFNAHEDVTSFLYRLRDCVKLCLGDALCRLLFVKVGVAGSILKRINDTVLSKPFTIMRNLYATVYRADDLRLARKLHTLRNSTLDDIGAYFARDEDAEQQFKPYADCCAELSLLPSFHSIVEKLRCLQKIAVQIDQHVLLNQLKARTKEQQLKKRLHPAAPAATPTSDDSPTESPPPPPPPEEQTTPDAEDPLAKARSHRAETSDGSLNGGKHSNALAVFDDGPSVGSPTANPESPIPSQLCLDDDTLGDSTEDTDGDDSPGDPQPCVPAYLEAMASHRKRAGSRMPETEVQSDGEDPEIVSVRHLTDDPPAPGAHARQAQARSPMLTAGQQPAGPGRGRHLRSAIKATVLTFAGAASAGAPAAAAQNGQGQAGDRVSFDINSERSNGCSSTGSSPCPTALDESLVCFRSEKRPDSAKVHNRKSLKGDPRMSASALFELNTAEGDEGSDTIGEIEAGSADDLFPINLYVFIKTALKNCYSEVQLLVDWAGSSSFFETSSDDAYRLATLQACLSYVQELDWNIRDAQGILVPVSVLERRLVSAGHCAVAALRKAGVARKYSSFSRTLMDALPELQWLDELFLHIATSYADSFEACRRDTQPATAGASATDDTPGEPATPPKRVLRLVGLRPVPPKCLKPFCTVVKSVGLQLLFTDRQLTLEEHFEDTISRTARLASPFSDTNDSDDSDAAWTSVQPRWSAAVSARNAHAEAQTLDNFDVDRDVTMWVLFNDLYNTSLYHDLAACFTRPDS
ncbi:Phosphatidylinositol 4-phosphate 5-kinase 8 [Diplonema papillatum]|nr:Phosphatidylinositol 4-phosphate 5-kinase 8 [Diplonema papillatum]KAJ9441556.1 Phosphatidylinositol 4-phosphate 5-kinase 8 [Diplonema papillatum]